MALNVREEKFLEKIQEWANMAQSLYGLAYELKQSFDEEFATAQENELSDHATELAEVGIDYADIMGMCNQGLGNYVNFWTGAAVNTREYGKDIRRLALNKYNRVL